MDSSNPEIESKGSQDEANTSLDLESMDPEQRQKVEEELKTELAKVRNEWRLFHQPIITGFCLASSAPIYLSYNCQSN